MDLGSFGLALPVSLPPLTFGGAAGGGTVGGGNGWNQGTWTVNTGAGSAAGGSIPILWIGLAIGAAWLLLRK